MTTTAPAPSRTTRESGSGARLGLGTVQFGVPYGLTSGPRQIAPALARAVLERAWERGVDLLDTAPAYGDSEAVIAAQWPASARFAVVSKTHRIGRDRIEPDDITQIIERAKLSIARFPRSALHALLVHEADDLLVPGGDRLFAALETLRRDGLIARLGVSVYHPASLEAVMARYSIDAVQLPFNVLDQRFARTGLIARLAAGGIEVHVRSLFMQGFLLGAPSDLPAALTRVAPLAASFREQARATGLDPVTAALLLAAREPGVARIVIGIDGVTSLDENLTSFDRARCWTGEFDFTPFAIEDRDVVDPRRWSDWPPARTSHEGRP